jgi:hypothetical protein
MPKRALLGENAAKYNAAGPAAGWMRRRIAFENPAKAKSGQRRVRTALASLAPQKSAR